MRWTVAEAVHWPEAAVYPETVDFTNGFQATTVDLAAAILATAVALEPLARAHWVRFDLAIAPETNVRVDRNALGMALRETMTTAVRATPGGRVVITAASLGSQMHVRIADDGWGDDQWTREASVRDASASIALQGGSVSVQATSGRGTTVTVRLAMPGGGQIGQRRREGTRLTKQFERRGCRCEPVGGHDQDH